MRARREEVWERELGGRDPVARARAALNLGLLAIARGNVVQGEALLEKAIQTSDGGAYSVQAAYERAKQIPSRDERMAAMSVADERVTLKTPPEVVVNIAAFWLEHAQVERALGLYRQVLHDYPAFEGRTESRIEPEPDDVEGEVGHDRRDPWEQPLRDRAVAAAANELAKYDAELAKHDVEDEDNYSAEDLWRYALLIGDPQISPEAAVRLAERYWGTRRHFAEVEELLKRAIDLDHPTFSALAALRLGEFFAEMSQPSKAAEMFELAMDDEAQRAEAKKGLAKLDEAGSGAVEGGERKLRRDPREAVKEELERLAAAAATRGPTERKRVLLLGAGTGGYYLRNDLDRDRYEILGFVDDDTAKLGHRIGDQLVLGTFEDLDSVLAAARPDEALFAVPTAPGTLRAHAAAVCQTRHVPLLNLPSMFELRRSRDLSRQLRPVRIEETYGNGHVLIDRTAAAYARGRIVLITGAGGSVGTELARQLARVRARLLILVDRSETALVRLRSELLTTRRVTEDSIALELIDCCDMDRLEEAVAAYQPQLVFHAAGTKNVSLMEADATEAVRSNVIATWNAARAAGGAERFVLVSSERAERPRSVLDATKLLAELAISDAAARAPSTIYSAVRLPNLFRSAGSVVEIFENQIEAGGPLTVNRTAVRRFVRTDQAVQTVLRAGGKARPNQIFRVAGGEELSMGELAKDMLSLAGPDRHAIKVKTMPPRLGEQLDEPIVETGEKWDKIPLAGLHEMRRAAPAPAAIRDALELLEARVMNGSPGTLGAERTQQEPALRDALSAALKRLFAEAKRPQRDSNRPPVA